MERLANRGVNKHKIQISQSQDNDRTIATGCGYDVIASPLYGPVF